MLLRKRLEFSQAKRGTFLAKLRVKENGPVFISSLNPSRQMIVHTTRDSVSANSVGDGRNRDRVVLVSYSSARTELSSEKVKLSIMGGDGVR